MSIAGLIHGYRSQVENIAYLNAVLAECPWADLCDSLLELVRSKDANNAASADLFIRDVFYRTDKRAEFRDHVESTGLPDAYRQNLFARNYYVRRLALGTLCTFDNWWSENDRLRARDFFEQNDPLSLSKLTTYVMRDSHWEDWSVPKWLVTSEDFLVKWAVTEVLDIIVQFPLPKTEILSEVNFCLGSLRQDVNNVVRIEADFLCKRVKSFEMMLNLPKLEKRKLSKALNKQEPRFRFSHFRNFVGRELSARQKTDFTMAELHELAEVSQKSR